jgi:hypothetical protein
MFVCMDIDVETAYATMLLCSFTESSSHCVCIIEYCMQETAVYGKGAIKDFVLGQYCFGMHATSCSFNS